MTTAPATLEMNVKFKNPYHAVSL